MIKTTEISVVVQGAIDDKNTPKCISSIRRHLPGAEILLSTWKGSEVSQFDCDKIILNEDPGAFDMSPWEKNNVKRQIISTFNGIKKAKNRYVLKIRSDIELKNANFLKYFDKFNCYDDKWHFLEKRIIITSMVSRDPRIWESPMCPSDWCSFGTKEDMFNLWDIPLPLEQEENWFVGKTRPNAVTLCYPALQARYNPEQTIWINFVKKYRPVHTDDMFDVNLESIEETLKSFANNLIIISIRQFGVKFLKKDRAGSDRWHVITHNDFLKIYHEYANGKKQYFLFDFQRILLMKYIPKSNKRLWKNVYQRYGSKKNFIVKELKYAFPVLSKALVLFVKLYFHIFKEDLPQLWWRLNENKQPLFSLVIPVHGRIDLFRKTLNSVSNLNSDVNDFEIVVSDDSSKKRERDEIQNFILKLHVEKGFNVKYVFSKPHLGQSHNTNQGLNHARGKWIRILHSDDLIHENLLSFEKNQILENGNISVIFHATIEFKNEASLDIVNFNSNCWTVKPEIIIEEGLHSHCAVPSALLFKKDIMDAIGKFNPALQRACDWDFFARHVLYSYKNKLEIIQVDKCYIFYRIHPRSNSQKMKTKFLNYQEYETVQNHIINELQKIQCFDKQSIKVYADRALLYRKARLIREFRMLSFINKIRFINVFFKLLWRD